MHDHPFFISLIWKAEHVHYFYCLVYSLKVSHPQFWFILSYHNVRYHPHLGKVSLMLKIDPDFLGGYTQTDRLANDGQIETNKHTEGKFLFSFVVNGDFIHELQNLLWLFVDTAFSIHFYFVVLETSLSIWMQEWNKTSALSLEYSFITY